MSEAHDHEPLKAGFLWMEIRSAEGRRSPGNATIAGEEYAAAAEQALASLAPRLEEMRKRVRQTDA